MENCDVAAYMPTTGSQPMTGPLPRWTAVYVLDTGYKAYRWMLANADAMAAYSVHYRIKDTGRPLSAQEYPCVRTRRYKASYCPATGDPVMHVPMCHGDCDSRLEADNAHHPAPAYVAYLVTGSWYYMSELQFWANWQITEMNPRYRGYAAGLIYAWQVRGQAWALRTLGYAAYMLPERAPFEDYFYQAVVNNIQWYNKAYTNNPEANKLGVIDSDSEARNYTGIRPWQQAFFMWSVGNLVDLGFPGAKELRDWLAQFWIDIFTSPNFCWQLASAYGLKVQETQGSPFYKTVGRVYDESYPAVNNLPCRSAKVQAYVKQIVGPEYTGPTTMISGPTSPTGYPASLQIGLAMVAESGLPGAEETWETFANRSPKPNYRNAPQFAVIPRFLGE